MPLSVFLVRFGEISVWLRDCGFAYKKREHRCNESNAGGSRPPGAMAKVWRLRRSIFSELGDLDPPCASFHFKFSISSSTSRRFCAETLSGPLCVPLYCHSSFC